MWAFVSLIGSFVILCNEIFLFFLYSLHPVTAMSLHQSYLSLAPSFHISILLTLVLVNGPLIMPVSHQGIFESFISIPSDLLYSLYQLYKIKFIILQLYTLVLALTFILVSVFFSK